MWRLYPSSVTVCHAVVVDEDDCGLRRDDQREVLGMVVLTPIVLCVLSTPAEIGDYTVVWLFCALLLFFSGDCRDGGKVGVIPIFL